MILKELHKGNAGGHFSQDITIHKVLDARYWWPTLYKDTYDYYQTCHECQKTGGLPKSISTKLITILPAKPFMKWGLNTIFVKMRQNAHFETTTYKTSKIVVEAKETYVL